MKNTHHEKKIQEQKLETLLIEGLESGDATPFTRADFEKIRSRAEVQLKTAKDASKLKSD